MRNGHNSLNKDLISKATRNAFREALASFTLSEIAMFFEGAYLTPDKDHEPQISSMRRGLVEQYYSNVDFRSHDDMKKLLSAYGEIVIKITRFNSETAEDLLRRMRVDGYDFDSETFIILPGKQQPLVDTIRSLASSLDLVGLKVELSRLTRAADEDPALAIGTAKEMVETICKTILADRGTSSSNGDFPILVRTVFKELSLLPEDIPSNARGAATTRRILSNLNQVAQGLSELRNLYGTGHGRDGRFVGMQPRHAKLAVGAATTLGVFLLETHLERKRNSPAEN